MPENLPGSSFRLLIIIFSDPFEYRSRLPSLCGIKLALNVSRNIVSTLTSTLNVRIYQPSCSFAPTLSSIATYIFSAFFFLLSPESSHTSSMSTPLKCYVSCSPLIYDCGNSNTNHAVLPFAKPPFVNYLLFSTSSDSSPLLLYRIKGPVCPCLNPILRISWVSVILSPFHFIPKPPQVFLSVKPLPVITNLTFRS